MENDKKFTFTLMSGIMGLHKKALFYTKINGFVMSVLKG